MITITSGFMDTVRDTFSVPQAGQDNMARRAKADSINAAIQSLTAVRDPDPAIQQTIQQIVVQLRQLLQNGQ